MPPGLVCLHEPEPHQGGNCPEILVDIIAVHGVGEDSETAWTHPETGFNWLQEILPKHVRTARVLAYGYQATTSTFFDKGADLRLQMIAESFIQELVRTDRYWRPGQQRRNPIIFVCHGLGGLLVKKCLFVSSTQTTQKCKDLYNLFVSTYAILFFGTPHKATHKSNWLALEALLGSGVPLTAASSNRAINLDDDVYRFDAIAAEFSPLIKEFKLFCYWEQLVTSFGESSGFVVDSASALMDLDEVQKAGIYASHSHMVKFRSPESSGLRMVLGALVACCYESPKHIANRWKDALPRIRDFGISEVRELGYHGHHDYAGHSFHQGQGGFHDQLPMHVNLPDDPRQDFVGREETLNVLYDAFFPHGVHNPRSDRKSYVVFGMGGCGKTQLCVRFAHIYREHYSAIFTICAASEESVKDSFRQIGERAGLQGTESAGRHVLSSIKVPWLLIVDNADDRGVNLRDIFPPNETAHILITTRNPDYADYGTLGSSELKGLDQDEALQLLLNEAKIEAPWDAATKTTGHAITKALGYLAIALIQAGSQIKKKFCTLGEYLSLHSTKRATFQYTKLKLQNDDDPVLAIYKTFDISMSQLLSIQSTSSQDALELLRIVSYFHFDRIPVSIFTRGIINRKRRNSPATSSLFISTMVGHVSTNFQFSSHLPNFLQRNSSDHWEIKRTVHNLAGLSLIRYDDNQAFSFGVHPLIHEWARDTIPSSERKTWAVIALNTLMESLVLPGDDKNDDSDDNEFHSSILLHLEACLSNHGDPFNGLWKHLQPISLALNQVAIRNSAKCGLLFAERGFFERATAYLQPVTEALIQGLGCSNETTLTAMLGLSQVWWGLGQLDNAIKYQSQVIEVRTARYGPEHRETLQAMNLLGRSFWLNGMYPEALAIQRIVRDRTKSKLGLDDPLTLSAMDTLGVILGSWHQFEESRKIHERVLVHRRKLFGITHPSTLDTMSNLAMAMLDLGKTVEALALMVKVKEHRQAKLGKEHPWTLWAHCYLAKVKIKMGLLQEAEKMLVWGIAAGERSLNKSHLGVLMGRGQLARVYSKQGRFDEAESLTLETIELLEPSRGIAHPDCVYAIYKLGVLYDRKQDHLRAVEKYELALERAALQLTKLGEHPLALEIEARRQIDLELLEAGPEPFREEPYRLTSPAPNSESLNLSQPENLRRVLRQQTW